VEWDEVTFREAFVPLIPRPITSPSCTKTQPTGVSSEARASSAMSMALRMKPSWYSRLGIGAKTILAELRSVVMEWFSSSQCGGGLVRICVCGKSHISDWTGEWEFIVRSCTCFHVANSRCISRRTLQMLMWKSNSNLKVKSQPSKTVKSRVAKFNVNEQSSQINISFAFLEVDRYKMPSSHPIPSQQRVNTKDPQEGKEKTRRYPSVNPSSQTSRNPRSW
jgi:hypothetical protein